MAGVLSVAEGTKTAICVCRVGKWIDIKGFDVPLSKHDIMSCTSSLDRLDFGGRDIVVGILRPNGDWDWI